MPLSPLIGMALPAIGPIAVVAKIPTSWKKKFFQVPPWLSSTTLAWSLGHMFTGVMAPYAMLAMDLILFPAFLLMKKKFEHDHGPVGSPWPVWLPQPKVA